MEHNMFKIANTVVKFVRNKGNEVLERGFAMNKIRRHTESMEEYNRLMEERRQLIANTRSDIQKRIEKVCREQKTITIDDIGFGSISSILFEDSWQEKVMNMLLSDGYHCMMSFSYDNGKLRSCLTVSWK